MSALSISSISRTGSCGRGERLPQFAAADVVGDVVDPRIAELAVAKPGDRVIFVEALMRLGRRLDVPFDQRRAERLGDLVGEDGLAGARLALDQQRPAQRDRGIDRDLEVVGGDIVGALEAHGARLTGGGIRSKLSSPCATRFGLRADRTVRDAGGGIARRRREWPFAGQAVGPGGFRPGSASVDGQGAGGIDPGPAAALSSNGRRAASPGPMRSRRRAHNRGVPDFARVSSA